MCISDFLCSGPVDCTMHVLATWPRDASFSYFVHTILYCPQRPPIGFSRAIPTSSLEFPRCQTHQYVSSFPNPFYRRPIRTGFGTYLLAMASASTHKTLSNQSTATNVVVKSNGKGSLLSCGFLYTPLHIFLDIFGKKKNNIRMEEPSWMASFPGIDQIKTIKP